jgi:hypothetical protein
VLSDFLFGLVKWSAAGVHYQYKSANLQAFIVIYAVSTKGCSDGDGFLPSQE